MPYDGEPIRIAGAGPAGLACAITLAEAGRAVEVHEARAEVGGRFDGDHQTVTTFGERPHGLDLLAVVGLTPTDLELVPLRAARFLDGRGRAMELASAAPYAWMLRRGPGSRTLEGALARRARSLGVGLITRSRIDPVEARVVATGAAAVDGVALERLFTTSAPDRVDVLFDTRLTPGGYAYLFIHGGEATAGVAALASYRHLELMMEEALRRFAAHGPFDVVGARQASHTMNFAIPDSAVFDGRLHVGEAAGFQDYLYGLGIRAALISGHLAGRALVTGEDYDQLWRGALRRRMLTSAVDRFLYERLPHGAGAILDRLAGRDLREGLERLQADSLAKRLLLPWVRRRWLRRCRAASTTAGGSVTPDGTRRAAAPRRGPGVASRRGRSCTHNLEVHLCRPPVVESRRPAVEEDSARGSAENP